MNGYIVDKKSGEAIIGVNVYDYNLKVGCTTNKFGYYSLIINKNINYNFQFSCISYDSKNYSIKLVTDTILNIELQNATTNLSEVIVSAQRKLEERTELGKINIPLSTIRTLPSITGEPDILKAYQLMPGVQMGSEGNNGLYVRGGTPDQNLFLLDDVPLYNVSHLGGFFSVFDPSMVKSVDLYKGGFPARYGGRISSVVDVRNKEGNLYNTKGEIAVGLISSKFFIEGPIKKGESSYAFSYRNCNFGIYSYLYKLIENSSSVSGYYFNDINFKANLKISQSDRLFLSFYTGEDNIYSKDKGTDVKSTKSKYSGLSEVKWGNTAGSIRWLHLLKNGIFNNTTIAYTHYNYLNHLQSIVENLTDKSNTTDDFQIRSGANDLLFKNDTEIPLENLTIRLGITGSSHSYIPSLVTYSQKLNAIATDTTSSPDTQLQLQAADIYGYAEFEYKLTDKLSTNAGFRTGAYFVKNTSFPVFEPRIVVNYMFLPSYSLKASYSNMHQNIHLLTNSNAGLPSDIWVPSTANIKPESSDQFSVGFAHTTKKNYEMSIELYTKRIQNLIEYKEGVLLYNGSQNWQEKVETGGIGNIKGFEVLIRKLNGKLTGWIGYTLSSNTRKFTNLNNGNEFPFTYDQTHNLSIVGNYKLTENLTLSAIWVYHTGNCVTLASSKYQLYNYDYSGYTYKNYYTDVQVYTEKNGYRLPDYHRLDIGLNRTKQLKKGIRNWSINIYNAYNHQNAYYVFYKKKEDGTIKLFQRSFFPILLNIGYSYKW
jgi:hypothetical protein